MKQLLIDAREEVLRLRRVNEILQAKVNVMEFFECVLHTKPAMPSQGHGEDIAWKLKQKINSLKDD